MRFYQFRRKVKRNIIDNFNYLNILMKSLFTKPKTKVIFIDITNIELNRYLSNLIKLFKLNDYTIYLPKDKKIIQKLCLKKGEFKYASFIIEGDFKIGFPNKKIKNLFSITKEQLSNDYFNPLFQNKNGIYHVPMSEYPEMYYESKIDVNIDYSIKRKRSVFMAGNFNPLYYKNIGTDGVFKILSRREIVDFMYTQDYYYYIPSFERLRKFIETPIDFKVVLIDTTEDFQMKINEYKKILREFDFFIALPGIEIPQSHNLIESMTMGCIPFIHKTYAELFYPPLVHYETAFIYETKQELDNLIKQAFNMNESEVLLMRRNILQYYKVYLSPNAVVEFIVRNNYSKIIVQAEHVSVNLLKMNRI